VAVISCADNYHSISECLLLSDVTRVADNMMIAEKLASPFIPKSEDPIDDKIRKF
jgi:hypothetical protein